MESKPLNRKNYGSIPHLKGSRLGPNDYCCTPGQSKYYQHRAFAEYVKREEKRFYDLLKEGERVAGEWLLVAH
ncbi:MAG: hypothetical protein AAF620_14200 [Bacteroidota bacterium]